MQTLLHKANSRGYAKHGWLTTHHSFSFASYYNPEMLGFGALRVLNDDLIAAGQGFGRHTHRDMEIITIPLSGALSHEDSMGNAAVIKTGEVQVMSAGLGVEHSEFNASETEAVSLLQIWILTRTEGAAPRYAQKRFDPSSGEIAVADMVLGKRDALGVWDTEKASLKAKKDAFVLAIEVPMGV